MIILLFIVCVLLLVVAVIVVVSLAKRLLQFDALWDRVDKDLTEYQSYLVDRTSRGILTDHPEVREFHQTTTRVRDAMAAHRDSIISVRGKGAGWASTSAETSTQR